MRKWINGIPNNTTTTNFSGDKTSSNYLPTLGHRGSHVLTAGTMVLGRLAPSTYLSKDVKKALEIHDGKAQVIGDLHQLLPREYRRPFLLRPLGHCRHESTDLYKVGMDVKGVKYGSNVEAHAFHSRHTVYLHLYRM